MKVTVKESKDKKVELLNIDQLEDGKTYRIVDNGKFNNWNDAIVMKVSSNCKLSPTHLLYICGGDVRVKPLSVLDFGFTYLFKTVEIELTVTVKD